MPTISLQHFSLTERVMDISASEALPVEATSAPFEPAGSVAGDRLPRQIVVVAAMYVGYAMFMVLRMIPTVAGAAIRQDPALGINLEVWGKILAVGTWGAVVGKIICGYAA